MLGAGYPVFPSGETSTGGDVVAFVVFMLVALVFATTLIIRSARAARAWSEASEADTQRPYDEAA